MLGQHIALPFFVSLSAREQFDLRDSLVRERRRHNERRMSRCATQIYQATLGQQNNALAVGENNVIDLRLDFFPLKAFNRSDIDGVIEVTNIADAKNRRLKYKQ